MLMLLTLEDVVPPELGDVGMVSDEVLQEAGELIALTQSHLAAHQVLVNDTQVEIVAERVHVHQVSHLVTLLCEQHGELEKSERQSQIQQNLATTSLTARIK